jgi:small subunit ribosomal protein S14
MKKAIINEAKRMLKFAESEPTRLALKYITYNQNIPLKIRLIAQGQLHAMPHKYAMTYQVRRCVFTQKAQGMIKGYNISRIVFKTRAERRLIPGVEKAMW